MSQPDSREDYYEMLTGVRAIADEHSDFGEYIDDLIERKVIVDDEPMEIARKVWEQKITDRFGERADVEYAILKNK